MVSLAADVADDAGRLLLSAGEPRLALDAASAGLTVDPSNEELLRLAVSSAIAAGRPELAARVRDRFLRELEEVIGDVDLAPETTQVLSRLALSKSASF
jgi:hypothetical protein